MKEAEFINPFNANFEKKMLVYSNDHKKCIGRCNCARNEIWIKCPNILETKIDDFCQRHKINFDNECHKLPSGTIKWMGCPSCAVIDNNRLKRANYEYMMRQDGMRINSETKEWYKPTPIKQAENDEYNDNTSRGFRNK